MATLHTLGDIVTERYRITATLGEPGRSNTYIAEDFVSNKFVAIKAISLKTLTDWKDLELLQRQAEVLAGLDHPAIPRYLEYFYVDTHHDRAFYLVQKLIRGDSLASLVEHGWHIDEAGLTNIALQVLGILSYLQEQSPPIIHRDIQPQNLLRSRNGKIFLVDFGSVKANRSVAQSLDSTLVGAYGYAPSEQFYGNACLSSDLYGLGATLLFLLTGTSPEPFLPGSPKLDLRSQPQLSPLSPHLIKWLEKMLEPSSKARFRSASEAMTALQRQRDSAAQPDFKSPSKSSSGSKYSAQPKPTTRPKNPKVQTRQRPANSRVIVSHTDGRFVIDVPSGDTNRQKISPWDVFGWWYRLEIYTQCFAIHKGWLGLQRSHEGKTNDLIKAEVRVESGLWGDAKDSLILWEGVTAHNFAPELTSVEKEWLANEIVEFLDELRLFRDLNQRLNEL